MEKKVLGYETSKYLKAVAIVMMIVHHFFAFPNRLMANDLFVSIGSIQGKPIEQIIGEMCKLCVCIFAFISGYGTYISFRKKEIVKERLSYVIKKIVNIISKYWVVMICFFIPILIIYKKISIMEILNNMLLNSFSIVHTGWYVAFYFEAMVFIFFYSIIEQKGYILDAFVCIAIPVILEILLPGNMFSHYFPTFMLGYIFSKHKLYDCYENKINSTNLKKVISVVVFLMLLVIRLKLGDTVGFISMITFMGPFICYVFSFVLQYIAKIGLIRKLLLFISKYSMWYWFLQAIFHTGILKIQRIGYFPKYPILIVIWVLVILTPLALLFEYVCNIKMGKGKQSIA